MKRRIISLLLILSMVLRLLPLMPNEARADDNKTWTEVVTSQPNGYAEDVDGNITISSNQGLAWLVSVVNGLNGKTGDSLSSKIVTLDTDIDLSGHKWIPIGTNDKPFSGTFDGGTHTISNMTVEGVPYAGLFGYSKETIKNLTVEGSVDTNGTSNTYAGGIVGYNKQGEISNCNNQATIEAQAKISAYAGGIVGYNESGRITNCSNRTNAETTIKCVVAGGIVGFNASKGSIINCFNSGQVNSDNFSASAIGGIAGTNQGNISNCNNSGNVSASFKAHTGGIVGSNEGNIINCNNSGYINASSSYAAGGLAGNDNGGRISNCYNSGSTTATASGSVAPTIGGLIGQIYTSGGTAEVINCYWLGDENSVGFGGSSGIRTNCSSFTEGQGKGTDSTFTYKIGDESQTGNLSNALNSWVQSQSNSSEYLGWINLSNEEYPTFTQLIPPTIFGDTELALTEGYTGTQTNPYTMEGYPAPTITQDETHGNKIVWDNENKKLDIEEGLEAGTYTVELTASNNVDSNAVLTFTLIVNKLYKLTLVGGTIEGGAESGHYKKNDSITIIATVPRGKVFDRWSSEYMVTFENANSASTSFTMPGKDITIEAIFKSSSSGSSPTDPPITDPTEPTKPSEPVKDDQISDTDKKIVVDVTKGGTLLTAEQTRNLIEINKTKPVEIQGNGYTITFPIGSMNETAGLTSLNLSLEVIAKAGDDGNSGQGKALLALADGNGLMAFSFKHSGPLPGMARIEITVGKEYAGQTLYYYYHNPKTGKLEYRQSGLVDKEGIITVNQDHCSDYLLSQKLLKNENVAEAPERISGANRYQTAIEIAKEYFKTGTKTVVLARGDSSADTLPAVPLAKYYDAPLLLTKSKELPAGVIKTIKELGATDVVLVGGEEAISLDIARELEKSGLTIERIYGINRYETAAAIARKLYKLGSNKEDPRAIIVNGNNAKNTYADALSISSWAGYEGVPLLYADNRTTELPQATAAIIKEQSITKTYLIGGTEVLSLGLEANLPNPERLGGKDRFATNTTILTKLQTNPTNLFMATGYNYADALAIGAISARDNSWLLLTGAKDSTNAKNGLTKEQQQLIASKKDALQNFTSVGGEVAVPKATLEAVKSLLKK